MRAIAELSVADWHRLNRLLEAGLGLEDEARVAWLSTLPTPDAELRPLLEQLLSPQDLTAFIKNEIASWTPIVESVGLRK